MPVCPSMLPWQRILTPWNATTEKVAMMRWAWGVVWLFAFTTAIYAQGADNREATTLILCFPALRAIVGRGRRGLHGRKVAKAILSCKLLRGDRRL